MPWLPGVYADSVVEAAGVWNGYASLLGLLFPMQRHLSAEPEGVPAIGWRSISYLHKIFFQQTVHPRFCHLHGTDLIGDITAFYENHLQLKGEAGI